MLDVSHALDPQHFYLFGNDKIVHIDAGGVRKGV